MIQNRKNGIGREQLQNMEIVNKRKKGLTADKAAKGNYRISYETLKDWGVLQYGQCLL